MPARDGLLDHVLDGRLVDDRQHLLGLGLGGRQEPGAEAGGGDDGLGHRALHGAHCRTAGRRTVRHWPHGLAPTPAVPARCAIRRRPVCWHSACPSARPRSSGRSDVPPPSRRRPTDAHLRVPLQGLRRAARSGPVVQRRPPRRSAPRCGGSLRKVFGTVGISFKGSGFYKTDSRGKSSTVELVRRRASTDSAVVRLGDRRARPSRRARRARRTRRRLVGARPARRTRRAPRPSSSVERRRARRAPATLGRQDPGLARPWRPRRPPRSASSAGRASTPCSTTPPRSS